MRIFLTVTMTRRAFALAVVCGLGLLAMGLVTPGHAGGANGRPAAPATQRATVLPVALPRGPYASAHARTLLVGSYHGVKGQYSDLQKAIDAARPGDWILVGPGDYRERANVSIPGAVGDDRSGAGFVVTKPNIHIRGMNRNRVWLDGTAAGPRCSRNKSDQNFGPDDASGNPSGRNGIVVYKVSGVSIENLSVCNFLSGDLTLGDEIWFDGGGSSGKETAMTFWGAYLTATSSYFVDQYSPSAQYGIYSSNTAGGPSVFTHDYASNFSDSDFYVGACPQCGVILDAVHAENGPEGYSGTNSGGVVIENSEFDQNRDGFDTNSQNNDDAPSPQTGECPGGGVNPHPPANPLVLGVRGQLRPRQQQPQRSGGRHRLQHPDRRRTDDHRRPLRHRHRQPLRQQRRVGHLSAPLPGHGDTAELGQHALPGRHLRSRAGK
jgi:hypothetical protein